MKLKIIIQAAVNILLIAAFIFTEVCVVRLLLAEVSSNRADRLTGTYKWDKAEEGFKKAIALDPYNSRYYAGFGELMFREALHSDDKTIYLSKAKALYEEALKMNQGCGEYALRLGQISLLSPDIAKSAKDAFGYFRTALTNDPNGFNVSYSIGYAGISVWKFLNKEEKEFILSRLKYSLKIKPWYSKYIYSRLWAVSGDFKALEEVTPEGLKANEALYNFIAANNLWQFRKAEADRVNYYKKKETPEAFAAEEAARLNRITRLKKDVNLKCREDGVILPEDWSGTADDGRNRYSYGNMWWTGTMDAVVAAPRGKAEVRIMARGSPASGVWPYMIVELDDTVTGEGFVDSAEWKEYRFGINTDGGQKVLSITFVNDGANTAKKEDRNLVVGEAGIAKGI